MQVFRKLGPKFAGAYIQVKAEDEFKTAAVGLTESLSPGHLEAMAKQGMSLFDIASSSGFEAPEHDGTNPGVQYLRSLTDDHLLALLEEVAPEHVAVLKRYPAFASAVARDLRLLLTGGRK